ncbi:MAG: phage major capsid protein [Clostridia bacterium]|nr:phage major capsid protein [Clostridia bacterium]
MADFDNLKLEKGMYAGGSFTGALERLDPSENYKGTALEGLDAYQRQLKRFGIRVSGPGSDIVDKFFSTSDSAVLFPEYVSRAVRQGFEQADLLPKIVACVTSIDGMDYRSVASIPSEDEKELKVVGEGAFIPETNVRTKENLVRLRKRGRTLVASYEAIKYQRLDLFTVTLRQIGAYIARTQLKDAVDVLINGDGNSNAAPTASCGTPGMLTYEDLIDLWNSFDPYEMNTLLCGATVMGALLNMEEFRDGTAGLTFHGTGKAISPLGATLLKSNAVADGKLLALDHTAALEMVKAGDVTTEYDKLIDRQLERAVISCTAGFSKLFDGAAKVLTV